MSPEVETNCPNFQRWEEIAKVINTSPDLDYFHLKRANRSSEFLSTIYNAAYKLGITYQ